jgi:hypothetical protein
MSHAFVPLTDQSVSSVLFDFQSEGGDESKLDSIVASLEEHKLIRKRKFVMR